MFFAGLVVAASGGVGGGGIFARPAGLSSAWVFLSTSCRRYRCTCSSYVSARHSASRGHGGRCHESLHDWTMQGLPVLCFNARSLPAIMHACGFVRLHSAVGPDIQCDCNHYGLYPGAVKGCCMRSAGVFCGSQHRELEWPSLV